MTKPDKTLKDLLLERVAHEEATLTQHPDVTLLADYLDNHLTEPAIDEIREHLAVCGACREELRHLDEPIEEFAPRTTEQRARQWAAFQSIGRRSAAGNPFFPQLGFAYGLAALLLVGFAGSLWWRTSSTGTLPNLDQAHLSPTSPGPSRETDSLAEIVLGQESPGLFLTLNLTNMEPFPAYALVIFNDPRPERPHQRITGLARKEAGNFTVMLPRNLLEEGVFWFVLEGRRDKEVAELAAYRVRISLP